MKNLILATALMAFTLGAYAQTDSTVKKMSPPDINNISDEKIDNSTKDGVIPQTDINATPQQNRIIMEDCAMMQNGKMMLMKDGKSAEMKNDISMSDGTKVLVDGTVIKKDGTKMMMKEGQHMDMNGKFMMMREPDKK